MLFKVIMTLLIIWFTVLSIDTFVNDVKREIYIHIVHCKWLFFFFRQYYSGRADDEVNGSNGDLHSTTTRGHQRWGKIWSQPGNLRLQRNTNVKLRLLKIKKMDYFEITICDLLIYDWIICFILVSLTAGRDNTDTCPSNKIKSQQTVPALWLN